MSKFIFPLIGAWLMEYIIRYSSYLAFREYIYILVTVNYCNIFLKFCMHIENRNQRHILDLFFFLRIEKLFKEIKKPSEP